MKLQILKFPFWKIRKVAGDKIILLRPQLIEPRIQTLVEDNNFDLWNLNWAVSMILYLLFAIWILSTQISTVYTLLPVVNFWMYQNSTSIGPSKRILNDNDVSAKKLLIWIKIVKVRACYFFSIIVVIFFYFHLLFAFCYKLILLV